jgi:hypothetical protein
MIPRKVILATTSVICLVLACWAETRKLTVDDVLFLKGLDVQEATILKKVQDSGTTFNEQELQQLKEAGLSGDFLSKVKQTKKPEPKAPKLTAENVLLLKDLGISEQTILTKIEDSGSKFSAADAETLKKGGLSDDFIAQLTKLGALFEEKEEKGGAVDAEAANEKLRSNVDEIGDHVGDAAEAVEKFEENLKKLESLKDGGILTEEELARSVEKAGDDTAKVLDEHTLKVLDLQKAVEAAPMLREKKAAVDLASYANQYLTALGTFVGQAHKGVPEQTVENRKKADDLKVSVQVAYDLYSKIVEPEQEEEKEKKEEKVVEKGLAGSWQLKAAGIRVDLVLGEDGSFSWHYVSPDETEDLKGTWKKVDDSSIAVTEEGGSTSSLVPCKLINEDTLQITVEGVVLQFNRVEEKSPKGQLEKEVVPKRKATVGDDGVDLSTPEAAVATFIRGCEAKDLDVLCQCISYLAEDELVPLRNRTASSKDLDELANLFREATIKSTDKKDSTAFVELNLKSSRKTETIIVIIDDERDRRWKIQSF